MTVRRPQANEVAKLKHRLISAKQKPVAPEQIRQADTPWWEYCNANKIDWSETAPERRARLKRCAARMKRRNK